VRREPGNPARRTEHAGVVRSGTFTLGIGGDYPVIAAGDRLLIAEATWSR
jgi:hypothetical protein